MAPVSAWLVETYQLRTAYMLTGILAWISIIPVAKFEEAEILKSLSINAFEENYEKLGYEKVGEIRPDETSEFTLLFP